MSGYREFQDGELIAGTRYRVVRLIGVGGMGTVYEVEHTELGKRFVLKALLRELSRRQDLVIRLRNEWRALGRLEHPHIVAVTDAGTSTTGVPFYVMERLEGDTLAQRMRKVGRFPVQAAAQIAVAVLDGLSAAHEIGVVHRDVKPPNIFLVNGDHAKILDFGVAKIADDPGVITARGVAVGTPRYMSPEQARGEKVDGRADVYSVGLILYEMLAGTTPFQGARDANALILAQLAEPPPPLVPVIAGVGRELEAAVLKMLEKRADARPATAREAAALLRAAILRPPEPERVAAAALPEVRLIDVGERREDTTRPDGVARKEHTATALSKKPVGTAFDDTALAPRHAIVTPLDGTLPSLRAVVTSLEAPAPEATNDEEPTKPGAGSRSWRPQKRIKATLPTELLSVVDPSPVATRTRLPNPPARFSETPPPVSPPPRASERGGARPPWIDRGGPFAWGLGALVFTTGLGFGVASVLKTWMPARSTESAGAEPALTAPATLETAQALPPAELQLERTAEAVEPSMESAAAISTVTAPAAPAPPLAVPRSPAPAKVATAPARKLSSPRKVDRNRGEAPVAPSSRERPESRPPETTPEVGSGLPSSGL